MRSSWDNNAVFLCSLTPGQGRSFVIKGVNIPSNPVAGHRQPFGPGVISDEPPWCHLMKSIMWLYEMVGQMSHFPALSWTKLSGNNWKSRCRTKSSLFLSMILRVDISTGVLLWWQCRVAQKKQLPLNMSSLEEYEKCIAEAGEHPSNLNPLYSTENCSKSLSAWLFKASLSSWT